ncbi:uncharacterized protein TNCV_1488081 [Trichonephila clavipes]|nr:uncharacterized protein TNCV_1488081 [Trichonephila clavipes]
MGKDNLTTIAISDYRTFVENVELSPPVQQNDSPKDYFRTTATVSFRVVTGMKPCLDLSPNQLALKIACGTETTFILNEAKIPLMRCRVFVLFASL